MDEGQKYLKGRGAQIKPANPFFKNQYGNFFEEGIDQEAGFQDKTQIFLENSKTAISKNKSPDLPWSYSVNPYQGCEHGCAYCYARLAHEYWGFGAGLDFESKLIVKQNIAHTLEKEFRKPSYKPAPVMLSGNTDCYQPLEKKYKLTRSILTLALRYRNPVGVITKNALILRDLDLLKELASQNLVHVFISITTLDEELRRRLEPRTSHSQRKLNTLSELHQAGVPCGLMMAPIIPDLNDREIPEILQKASEAGALSANYTVVRLNGRIAEVFEDWLRKNFPDRADKVLNKIKSLHGGELSDSEWKRRFSGEGPYALSIRQLFQVMRKKYFANKKLPDYDTRLFRRSGQPGLFD